MTIAILSTGDEIIYGDTLNTNGHTIARNLSSEKLRVGLHLSCSDLEQDIMSCLDFLSQTHDTIILTGGLGPTSDDRTRFALARFLNIELEEHPSALAHVQTLLSRANLQCNAGNRQQALFPVDATLLPNPNGTAMGCCYFYNNKRYILLPGPPRECLPMFDMYVLPELQKLRHDDKQLLKWRLFGVAEGEIAHILDGALTNVDCEIGYRLETPYVEFKVRCCDDVISDVKQIVEPLVAAYIISPPEYKASDMLRLKIEELQIPIVIMDDVTGGLLQTLLQRPGDYQSLMFYERPSHDKRVGLHFHLRGLDEYWLQQSTETIQVSIAYHAKDVHGCETHQLPHRRLIVEYAVEWISFRLLHLINQLHQRVT